MNDIVQVDTLPELKAQMETAVDIAKRYPRDLAKIKKNIADIATTDHATAESCFYGIPRGGKIIEGPSIRLAEIVAYSWEHIRLESRVSKVDASTITCEAICWDMERNLMARKSVSRKILDKYGKRYNEDMINTTANAGMAIAERNAIFKVIPMAVLKDVVAFIKQKANNDPAPLEVKVGKALTFCASMKINREAVLSFLGKKDASEINEEDLADLKLVLNAIKEGATSISDVFFKDEKPEIKDPLAEGEHGKKKPSKAKKEEKEKEEAPVAETENETLEEGIFNE